MRRVLGERRQQLDHDRDPSADEDDVEHDVGEEDAVADHVPITARLVMRLDVARCRDESQHRHER